MAAKVCVHCLFLQNKAFYIAALLHFRHLYVSIKARITLWSECHSFSHENQDIKNTLKLHESRIITKWLNNFELQLLLLLLFVLQAPATCRQQLGKPSIDLQKRTKTTKYHHQHEPSFSSPGKGKGRPLGK